MVATLGLCAVGLVHSSAGLALLTGRLAARSGRPALLIAGGAAAGGPWAAARAHTAVMLAALVGAGWAVMRRVTVEMLRDEPRYATADASFYVGGYNLAGLALLIGVAVTFCGLAVGVVESVTDPPADAGRPGGGRDAGEGAPARRSAGDGTAPHPGDPAGRGLGLTLVAPVVAIGQRSALPLLESALIAVGLLAAALLATAASLPLLRRTVHPAQLRYE